MWFNKVFPNIFIHNLSSNDRLKRYRIQEIQVLLVDFDRELYGNNENPTTTKKWYDISQSSADTDMLVCRHPCRTLSADKDADTDIEKYVEADTDADKDTLRIKTADKDTDTYKNSTV